jgi:N6-adenosine-specific RNA methylase IME4
MIIKDEFKKLIPPLAIEEFNQLEKNIIADGCRDPLLTWNGILIDGHNRYEICTKHGLSFSILEKDFADSSTAKLWMIDNQNGRRNLTDGWKFQLSQAKKEILLEVGREKQKETLKKGDSPVLSIVDKTEHNTRDTIANDLGWSTGKVAMADKVWKEATPEVKEQVLTGEISINEAYKGIKKVERAIDIEKQREDIANNVMAKIDGLFEVISIDPPWNYGRAYDPDSSRVANPYPEMTQSELLSIELPFSDDSVCLLWTTQAFIFDAKELLDKWGFTYKATIVWDKEKMGMGAWLRMQCEFCLIGIKGNPAWNNTKYRDIIREPRREHSRKPDCFFEMIEEITVGRRLEYFSRENRKGWEVYGNETNKF